MFLVVLESLKKHSPKHLCLPMGRCLRKTVRGGAVKAPGPQATESTNAIWRRYLIFLSLENIEKSGVTFYVDCTMIIVVRMLNIRNAISD